MNKVVDVLYAPSTVTIALKRDTPVWSWPFGQQLEWEHFVFPRRCKEEVVNLALDCCVYNRFTYSEARELIKERRRAILWP